jgi:YVTN family beta-propeller protein
MKISRRSTLAALAAVLAFPAFHAWCADAPSPGSAVADRYEHNGVAVDFTMTPGGRVKSIMEGELADVRFRLTDPATGQPIRGSVPGAWMDMAQVIQGRGAEQKSCKDKISLYLRGVVGIRPMVDLNSYYVVLLNNDASIAVVDPVVSMAGATSTLASVLLAAPGADWVASTRDRRLYISMPRAGQVAVIDTETFTVIDNIAAGKTPVRVALQPDGRYLWIGNSAAEEDAGGVTVIDVESRKSVAFIAAGAGHHEIAFSADSRHAFLTSRNAGTVTVIDVASRKVLKTLKTGAQPIAVAHSALSRSVYVADGKDGQVSVIDGDKLEIAARIALKPGLGPLRVSPDGRFVLALNPQEDLVHVIDAATRERVQDIRIAGQPFQITFTSAYAYVRSMHSERVSMINLSTLGKGKQASVQSFAAGAQAPATVGAVAIADSVAAAAGEGTVFVVNPADGTTYYYMEGMNATSSNYRVYGSSPRAVTVVDRSLKEVEPGVYAGRVRLPVAGKYDVAFMLQSPQVLHCFSAEAAENPAVAREREPLKLAFQTTQRRFKVGETASIRFRLSDPATDDARPGIADVNVMTFLAPGRMRSVVPATDLGDGLYEARIALPMAGAWYVHVGVPGLKIGYERMGFFSLQALEPSVASSPVATR